MENGDHSRSDASIEWAHFCQSKTVRHSIVSMHALTGDLSEYAPCGMQCVHARARATPIDFGKTSFSLDFVCSTGVHKYR